MWSATEETWWRNWMGIKFEGTVYTNKENEPKATRVGSVCRGYDDVLN